MKRDNMQKMGSTSFSKWIFLKSSFTANVFPILELIFDIIAAANYTLT